MAVIVNPRQDTLQAHTMVQLGTVSMPRQKQEDLPNMANERPPKQCFMAGLAGKRQLVYLAPKQTSKPFDAFRGEGLWGMGRPHVAGRRSSFTVAAQCACC